MSEFVVLPRQDISRSEVQTITVSGNPTGGYFTASFNGRLISVSWNDTADVVQSRLQALPDIGRDNVIVTGGPGTISGQTYFSPYVVTFTNRMSNRDVPEIQVQSYLTGGTSPSVSNDTTVGGLDATDEVAHISDADQHHLETARDLIRPVNSIPRSTTDRAPVNVSRGDLRRHRVSTKRSFVSSRARLISVGRLRTRLGDSGSPGEWRARPREFRGTASTTTSGSTLRRVRLTPTMP
jgi:hypothetical protein